MTEDLHHAALQAAGILLSRRPPALPVDPLAILRDCADTCVYTREAALEALDLPAADLLCDEEAVTLRVQLAGKYHYIVIYRVDGNPARMRFTLAHELGHRVLGHTGSTLAEERAADCFASHLLCPEPLMDHFRRSLADDPAAADRIAVACYVSRSCARLALRRPRADLPEDISKDLNALCGAWLAKEGTPKAE